MTFEEKTLESEYVYKGHILNLRKDKVTVINGTSTREIIEHNGGAVLIAINDVGKMIMVEQYRKPVNRVVLEAPAGKIDDGEEPLKTAKRELKEETGYTAKNVEFLTKIYPSVGYSEEALYIYLCTNMEPGETDFDENEALDIKEFDIEELYSLAISGKIQDGKTVIAILMVKCLKEEGKLQKYLK